MGGYSQGKPAGSTPSYGLNFHIKKIIDPKTTLSGIKNVASCFGTLKRQSYAFN